MEEYDQAPIETTPYASPMHSYGSTVLQLTDPKEVLADFEYKLRRIVKRADGTLAHLGKPLLNDEGIADVIGMVSSLANQVGVLTDIKGKEHFALIDYHVDKLIISLMLKKKAYGIRHDSDRNLIMAEFIGYVYTTLARGRDGGERRFLKGSMQEIQTNVTSGNQKGVLSAFNPFKR